MRAHFQVETTVNIISILALTRQMQWNLPIDHSHYMMMLILMLMSTYPDEI
jgi:hypothetical protein